MDRASTAVIAGLIAITTVLIAIAVMQMHPKPTADERETARIQCTVETGDTSGYTTEFANCVKHKLG